MATKSLTKALSDHDHLVTWETLTESDTCEAYQMPRYAYGLAMQAWGTWGSATLTLQGSLDGTNFYDLQGVDGSAISMTANGLDQGFGMVKWIKPVASGGSSQDLDIIIQVSLGPERSA